MISERSFAQSFDSFWTELLPLLTPRFIALFNQVYAVPLFDSAGHELSSLPVPPDVSHPDIVAEFAFQLAKACFEQSIPFENVPTSVVEKAELEAMQLIARY